MDKLSLLRSVMIFGGVEESLLVKISAHLKETRFKAGERIFAQGDPADSFFIIDSGEVVISKKIGAGHGKTLAVLGSGSVFGEMAFFSDSPRTADAVSKADTALWKIERGDFMKFMNDEPKAGLRVLSGLLQVSMDRLEQTSRELATIYETGKIISSGKRLGDILGAVLDEILLALPEAGGGAAYIYNEYNDEFDPAAAPAGAGVISPSSPMVKFVKDRPQGFILTEAAEIEPLSMELFKGARSLIVSPIQKEFALLGFILLWSPKPGNAFRSGNLLLVSTVSSQLAEAIENIRHQQDERDRQRLNNAKQSY